MKRWICLGLAGAAVASAAYYYFKNKRNKGKGENGKSAESEIVSASEPSPQNIEDITYVSVDIASVASLPETSPDVLPYDLPQSDEPETSPMSDLDVWETNTSLPSWAQCTSSIDSNSFTEADSVPSVDELPLFSYNNLLDEEQEPNDSAEKLPQFSYDHFLNDEQPLSPPDKPETSPMSDLDVWETNTSLPSWAQWTSSIDSYSFTEADPVISVDELPQFSFDHLLDDEKELQEPNDSAEEIPQFSYDHLLDDDEPLSQEECDPAQVEEPDQLSYDFLLDNEQEPDDSDSDTESLLSGYSVNYDNACGRECAVTEEDEAYFEEYNKETAGEDDDDEDETFFLYTPTDEDQQSVEKDWVEQAQPETQCTNTCPSPPDYSKYITPEGVRNALYAFEVNFEACNEQTEMFETLKMVASQSESGKYFIVGPAYGETTLDQVFLWEVDPYGPVGVAIGMMRMIGVNVITGRWWPVENSPKLILFDLASTRQYLEKVYEVTREPWLAAVFADSDQEFFDRLVDFFREYVAHAVGQIGAETDRIVYSYLSPGKVN